MKTQLRALLILLAIVLIVPAIHTTAAQAQTEKELKTPPPPPAGVSPATQDIQPPDVGVWRCPKCGAEFPGMNKRAFFNRPMPGARGGQAPGMPCHGQAFERPGGYREACGMHDGRRGRGHRRGAPEMRGPRGGNAAMRMARHAEALDLTEAQVAKLEQIADDTRVKMIDLRAAMEKERVELQRLRRSESDDLSTMRRHLKSIADLRVDMQTARIANRIDARKILTDEQRAKLKKRDPRMHGKFNCR